MKLRQAALLPEAVGVDPGDEANASVWISPDPHHAGNFVFYCGNSGGIYVDGSEPPRAIHFAGTHPSRRGFPSPEEDAAVGTPLRRFMDGLMMRGEWCDWIGIE